MSIRHCFIPDVQITPWSKTDHLTAAAHYLHEKRPDKIIIIGDWWDMPSLSVYDKAGAKGWEDKDYPRDVEVGQEAMDSFLRILKGKQRKWRPEIHFCYGNHEQRMLRAADDPHNRKFASSLSGDYHNLTKGYALDVISHDFLEIANIDGIMYSHYFVNPESLLSNSIGGAMSNKLNKLGGSFSMGHQQVYQTGEKFTADGRRMRGLVAGRFYQDEQDYLGPQKNKQSWSGIIIKNEVKNGDYDLLEVSMNYLLREWS
jgi:hypothetical protein